MLASSLIHGRLGKMDQAASQINHFSMTPLFENHREEVAAVCRRLSGQLSAFTFQVSGCDLMWFSFQLSSFSFQFFSMSSPLKVQGSMLAVGGSPATALCRLSSDSWSCDALTPDLCPLASDF